MKFEEFKVGKKYYHSLAVLSKDKMTGRRGKFISTVFVVELDTKNKKICASINGAPAIWYEYKNYGRWIKEYPTKTEIVK